MHVLKSEHFDYFLFEMYVYQWRRKREEGDGAPQAAQFGLKKKTSKQLTNVDADYK